METMVVDAFAAETKGNQAGLTNYKISSQWRRRRLRSDKETKRDSNQRGDIFHR